jgi:hypothetical protein
MSPAQSAFIVLATLFGVFGFSLPFSALAMPPLPSFRRARDRVWMLAGASILACIAMLAWGLRP